MVSTHSCLCSWQVTHVRRPQGSCHPTPVLSLHQTALSPPQVAAGAPQTLLVVSPAAAWPVPRWAGVGRVSAAAVPAVHHCLLCCSPSHPRSFAGALGTAVSGGPSLVPRWSLPTGGRTAWARRLVDVDNELEAALRSRRPEVSLDTLATLSEAVSTHWLQHMLLVWLHKGAGGRRAQGQSPCGGSQLMVPSLPAGLAEAACLGPAGHQCLPGSHQGREHLPDAQPGHHSHPHCPRCAGDSRVL